MLKREHFKQIRRRMARKEATFFCVLRQESKRLQAISSTVYLRFSQHAGIVILLMLIILMAGTAGVIIKRKRMGRGEEKKAGAQLWHHTRKIGHVLTQPILSNISQELDVLSLEKRLAQVMHKDSLRAKDRIFLTQLNQYLNGVSPGRSQEVSPLGVSPSGYCTLGGIRRGNDPLGVSPSGHCMLGWDLPFKDSMYAGGEPHGIVATKLAPEE